MAFLKRWKENWELKSLTQDELFNVIVEIVTKQLDEVEKDEVSLEANLGSRLIYLKITNS